MCQLLLMSNVSLLIDTLAHWYISTFVLVFEMTESCSYHGDTVLVAVLEREFVLY